MSIRYYVDQDKQLVLTVIDGHVKLEHLFTYVDTAVSDSNLSDYSALIQINVLNSSITSREIAEVASRANAKPHNATYIRTAVVAPANLAYGLSRVYQSHRTPASNEFAVFREITEAANWLELQDKDFDIEGIDSELWTTVAPVLA